jgi:hypothetical protein
VIDEWHDRLAAKKLNTDNTDNNDPLQPTVATNAFVQVIMILRKTFPQDSVRMMELRPCHLTCQHSTFPDPAYLPFKREVSIVEFE